MWDNDFEQLRAAAAVNLKREWLQRWWCSKYNRPRKDPLLASYTIEELMVEYLEDRIDEDPEEAYPAVTTGDDVVFRRTGDAVVDKWEQQLAKGEEIDPFEGVSAEERAKIERMVRKKTPAADTFTDSYKRG